MLTFWLSFLFLFEAKLRKKWLLYLSYTVNSFKIFDSTFFRRADDAKNEIHIPSDVLERLSQADMKSTLSTNYATNYAASSTAYPVARVVGDDEKDFVLF